MFIALSSPESGNGSRFAGESSKSVSSRLNGSKLPSSVFCNSSSSSFFLTSGSTSRSSSAELFLVSEPLLSKISKTSSESSSRLNGSFVSFCSVSNSSLSTDSILTAEGPLFNAPSSASAERASSFSSGFSSDLSDSDFSTCGSTQVPFFFASISFSLSSRMILI